MEYKALSETYSQIKRLYQQHTEDDRKHNMLYVVAKKVTQGKVHESKLPDILDMVELRLRRESAW